MKTDRLKWKWSSSLEAERSRAGPDKCVCIGLRLSGQIPQNDTRAQGRAGDSRVSHNCCHGDGRSGSLDSSPRDSGGFSKKPQEHVTFASRGMLSDAPRIASNGKHI